MSVHRQGSVFAFEGYTCSNLGRFTGYPNSYKAFLKEDHFHFNILNNYIQFHIILLFAPMSSKWYLSYMSYN
jgi:hypothetical protein